MANKRVSIPITNEADEDGCTQYYQVRYRRVGFTVWETLYPNPIQSPIVIERLPASTDYEVEVTRVCCNGESSLAATTTFNTGT